ncbi:MAG: sterol desaturase family protein [Saprospiraceae bacterium]|jgi:beta-carotene 3-hydroxylase|nr:sterol desaturase family protein [Saprospiraceae bacterium]MBK6481329.1 sterol desaturase family protein [Saprospiraceae bacterium]MBK6818027.1 sterol desaturase family protein [Saprospiraceae bacterium]MBK7370732.1 sterol desaturase family protein [Saprospiraceae bacterium]MBK7436723.1 sterol desaturase family protein [Saprospiraceae bacterium]
MMSNILVTAITFVAMEGVAWSAHKYLMHGQLWSWHHDHHDPQARSHQFFEKNDRFFLVFAIPSFFCFLSGLLSPYSFFTFIGLGILIYGFCYFLVHDVFIHQRFKWLRNSDSIYFRAIRKAHKVHHKHLSKEDGECFGMLWVPLKYFREAAKAK